MRQRRAERCRLRAEVAIEAGLLDDAREALEEARLLHPHLPELPGTEARLADAQRPEDRPLVPEPRPDDAREALEGARLLHPDLPGLPGTEARLAGDLRPVDRRLVPEPRPFVPERRRGSLRGFAMAACILVAGYAGWLISGEPPSQPATETTAAATPVSSSGFDRHEPAASTGPAPVALQPPAAEASTSGTDVRSAVAGDQVASQPAQPVAGSAAEREPASPLVSAVPLIEVPTPASPPQVAALEPTAVPSTDVPAAPPPVATPALPPPSTPAPSAAPPNPEPAASAPARTVAAEPGAETQVRTTLSQYEAAYSRLDAAAARAVWPAVDANALGRAFKDLQSQQVSLGNCSVVIGPGRQSARANCTGTATWTPKVGGGSRTAARRWTFELELAGDRWQIVRAITR